MTASSRETDSEPSTNFTAKAPMVTVILLMVIVAAFGIEIALTPGTGLSFKPSLRTLVRLGALNRDLVISGGEWWRLFSAPLLHANFLHIVLNSLALYFAGTVLERVTGPAWFAAIYAASGLSGAAFSIIMNDSHATSVGASGPIMGILAAALILSFRYESESAERNNLLEFPARVLLPSLIPAAGERVDIAAHFGGAMCGAIVGGLLFLHWQRDEKPPGERTAWALAAAGLGGVLFSLVKIASG
jgi:rhomboid protease GluP